MTIVETAFAIVTFILVVGLSYAIHHQKTPITIILFWIMLSGILAQTGFFKNTSSIPPRFLLVIIPAFQVVWICYTLIKKNVINPKRLMALSIIRIPVEIFIYLFYKMGLMPKLMTFQGYNWDIISGISALFIIIYYLNKPIPVRVLSVWNLISFLLLIIIVFIAFSSAPSPVQFLSLNQPNIAVLRFPYTWLPAVIVPIIFLSHLLIFRYLKNYR